MSIATEITRLQTAKADLKTAIESKGVTVPSATLLDGYADLVKGIQTGGGDTTTEDGLINGTLTSYENTRVTKVDTDVFSYNQGLVSLSLPNVTSVSAIHANSIKNNPNLEHVYVPKLKDVFNSMNGFFQADPKLRVIALPSRVGPVGGSVFYGDTLLSAADLGPGVTQVGAVQAYYNCRALTLLVIRRTTIATLGNVNSFANSPFGNGGSGGTIYIPKVLYDELGTGSANDYKAATNWSTVDGYGTITWAQIEGSQYENYYADGTPIPTT